MTLTAQFQRCTAELFFVQVTSPRPSYLGSVYVVVSAAEAASAPAAVIPDEWRLQLRVRRSAASRSGEGGGEGAAVNPAVRSSLLHYVTPWGFPRGSLFHHGGQKTSVELVGCGRRRVAIHGVFLPRQTRSFRRPFRSVMSHPGLSGGKRKGRRRGREADEKGGLRSGPEPAELGA